MAINKGEIVKQLVARHTDLNFIFCAGDDKTDEDMFRALKSESVTDHAFCCTIGPASKRTNASWHLEDPSDLIRAITQWSSKY